MPFKRKFTRRRRRTKAPATNWTAREFRSIKRNMGYLVPRYRTPFPTKYQIKLVYTGWVYDAFAGDGTNTFTSYQFKLNSCYDPYSGVSGTYNVQPYFWDQVSAIYKRYVVTGAKVEYKACAPSNKYSFVLMRPSTVSTLPSDFQLEESRERAIKNGTSTGGNGSVMSAYYSVASIHGVSPSKVKNDDLYSATVGADPSLVAYLNIMQQNADGTTTANPQPFNVKITQYITMYDRTVVSGS